MITRIREVRRARGMTLDDVARACDPPTTPQTIGRLEMGTRTVSIGWLNRIAKALHVEASDLVEGGGDDASELKVAAIVGPVGAAAPARARIVVPPSAGEGQVALLVAGGVGDYRSGDEIWCDMLAPDDFARALNRDVLVPRAAGRFLFARLIDRDEERLQLLPLHSGARQQVVANPPWIAVAVKLIRAL
ncbi:MAG TPA: helix-turn-helix transcriptional regulator [Sphingomicrobium sp.]|nr:helix-turn-helix transcriptional regulator [Sphingomicrobium sp.]